LAGFGIMFASHFSRIIIVSAISMVALFFGIFNVVSHGAFIIAYPEIAAAIMNPLSDDNQTFVIWELRLPRAFLGAVIGASLGVAGAIIQSVTRNPLGSPSLTGVTSGAALAVIFSVVFFDVSSSNLIFSGILGGYIAAAITFTIARQWHFSPIHLTLAGVSVSIFATACISVIMIVFAQQGNGIFYWMVGSFNGRTWVDFNNLWHWALIGMILALLFSRYLDVLLLDDDTCQNLGVKLGRWRFFLGSIAVILTAACVAVAGPISFVGLISPHIVRVALNVEKAGAISHKILIPLSALVGAALMSFTDGLSKARLLGGELPVGIFSILVGGMILLFLMKKKVLS